MGMSPYAKSCFIVRNFLYSGVWNFNPVLLIQLPIGTSGIHAHLSNIIKLNETSTVSHRRLLAMGRSSMVIMVRL